MSAVARGARLGIEDLRAPAIPDAENFAAVPIFQNLFVEAKAGTSAPKPFAALKMEGYRPPESKGSRQPLIPDLPSWRDHFVVRGVIPEATEDVGADVLRALQAVEPELAQLREAGQRPHSRFPVDAQLGVEAPVPHLTPILTAARAYHLAIAAHLATGDSASAYQSCREMLRLYQALRHEPTMITALTRVAVIALLDATVRRGLVERRWAEPELRKLAEDYSRFDWISDCEDALGTERMYINRTTELWEKQSSEEIAHKLYSFGFRGNPAPDPFLLRVLVTIYPRGWGKLGNVKLNEFFDRKLARVELLRSHAASVVNAHEDEFVALGRGSLIRRLPYWSALHSIPTIEGLTDRYLQIIAQTRITHTAFHLALHHQDNGSFPLALEKLVPAYLPEIPRDPMDLAPLRYRLTESGYSLWSIGLDCRDDGGKHLPGKDGRDQPDWVFEN